MTFEHLFATALIALAMGGATAAEPAVAATAAASAPAALVSNPQFHILAVDDAWRSSLPRNADAATQAYMDRLPPDVVARSNGYFEGSYWLQLWNFLLGLAISLVLLGGRRSARVRDWAQRVGRKAFVRDAIYGGFFSVAGWLLSLPLTIYQGYVREHAYGMATQTFGPWFAEQLIGLAVGTVVMALAVAVLYAVIRRTGERWWLWGTAAAVALTVLTLLIGGLDRPAVQHLQAGRGRAGQARGADDGAGRRRAGRQRLRVRRLAPDHPRERQRRGHLRLGRGAPERQPAAPHFAARDPRRHGPRARPLRDEPYLQEHRRVRARVPGRLPVRAVGAMQRLLARYAERFSLQGVGDVASLPLLAAVFACFMFVATPITNTLIRTQEVEADRFGLNLAREPYGEAEVDLKLTEYRKPDPGPVEEFIFFDHPSTRARIHDAMRWREAMGTP
jgi:STE24 endopeptidase